MTVNKMDNRNRQSRRVENIQALYLVFLVLLIIVFYAVDARSADDGKAYEALRRFAFIAASNDGGPGRVQLQYAHSDAIALAKVLQELGGVSSDDEMVLVEPSVRQLREGVAKMAARLRNCVRPGQRIELLFYYSGHSDENGLLLGADRLSYKEVRRLIESFPADVRIAVVDSCASGALTRRKGGKKQAPFMVDNSAKVRGYAFLTSASANEAAQESDRVGGSFFTHYLVSGLRGAADSSRDGRITINEAYHYAFHETLARTESTQAGPQHPNYDIQLAGTGDLVLTDLSGTSAMLILAEELDGRLFIRDKDGRLVAEIAKISGRPMAIGLEPGEYQVTLQLKAEWRKGIVVLEDGKKTVLKADKLKRTQGEVTVARGVVHTEDDIYTRPVNLSFVPGLNTNWGIEQPIRNYFSVNLLVDWSEYLTGLELSTIGAIRRYDVTGAMLSGVFNYTGGDFVGLEGAGVANINLGNSKGFQGGFVGNYGDGNFTGVQASAGANINKNSFKGIQGTAGVNYNGDNFTGLQGSAGVNVNLKSFVGAQITGGLNYAGHMRGLQASYINITPWDFTGMQLGMVNYAGQMKGVQVGLVNFSQRIEGVPLGIFNYSSDGILAPTFWISETSAANVGLKMGSRHVYGIYGMGMQPVAHDAWVSIIFGLGAHADFDTWYIDTDLTHFRLYDDDKETRADTDSVIKLRCAFGYRTSDLISFYGGPSLNLMVSQKRDSVGPDISFGKYRWEPNDPEMKDVYYKFYPGLFLGMQFEPKWGYHNSH